MPDFPYVRHLLIAGCLLAFSCSVPTPEMQQLVARITQELNGPIKPEQAAHKMQLLELSLEPIIAHPEQIKAEWLPFLCEGVARYQLYYFVQPHLAALEKLRQYYHWADTWQERWEQGQGKEFRIGADFVKLRRLLEWVDERSRRAPDNIKYLLNFWTQHPHLCQSFFNQLRYPWEVGGIIFASHSSRVWWQFVPDQQRQQNYHYIEELKENRFDNLARLEKIFLSRLSLQRIGANPGTQQYTDTVLSLASKAFASLHAASKYPTPWPSSLLTQIEKAKATLFMFDLESKILKQSYFMDKTPYLGNSDTAFFFHSHTQSSPPYYHKEPSKHDEEMTFRTGPSLVFDVHNEYIALYLVTWGKSTRIQRFKLPTSSLPGR